jgi:hypothetical protein
VPVASVRTTAPADLTRALINLAASGLRTHCSDPGSRELWVSDHPAERTEAARLCIGCPVLTPAVRQPTPETNAGTSGEDATTPAADHKESTAMTKAERINYCARMG